MAGQSLLMGEAFGKGFQYGKRKISAMSNDEFNALDAKQLGEQIATDYNDIIPSLEQAVRASSAFQSMIIQEMGVILKSIPDEILKFFGLEGLGGTESELLNFNLAQIKLWSDLKLRAAFENSFALYNAITQILITQQYNERISGTEPEEHVHEPEHHPPIITTIPKKEDVNWLNINASGRIIKVATATWDLQSNIAAGWTTFDTSGSEATLITKAISTWPFSHYLLIRLNTTTFMVRLTKL